MTTVTVRPVRSAAAVEVDQLAELVRQLSTSASEFTRDVLDEMLAHDAVTLLVARIDEQVVGMLSLACFPTPTGIRAWIEDVVTDETVRGAGVGSALVRAGLEAAKEIGARTVDLTSRPSREAANRLYVHLGFVRRESNLYRYSLD